MKGTKIRSFTPLPSDVSLDDLVPRDHFYRRMEAHVDLSFVRELVVPLYAKGPLVAYPSDCRLASMAASTRRVSACCSFEPPNGRSTL